MIRASVDDVVPIPTEETGGAAWILIVRTEFISGAGAAYVVPVARIESGDGHRDALLDSAAVICADPADPAVSYVDALYHEPFRRALRDLIARGDRVETARGGIVARAHAAEAQRLEQARISGSYVLRTEQSNSSILFGDRLFVKLYRHLEEGVNPDVELTRLLGVDRRFDAIPPYIGDIHYRRMGRPAGALALCIGFVPNQGNAMDWWRLQIDSFFSSIVESGDRNAPDGPPSTVAGASMEVPPALGGHLGVSFLPMVARLGERTAQLHRALAAETTNPDFVGEPFTMEYQRSLEARFGTLLERVYSVARDVRERAEPHLAEQIDTFLGEEATIRSRFSAVAAAPIDARRIRIHGDFHLEQVLVAGDDVVIIDLEGEPARTLSERRAKFSPLRDVAGMLRSFDYAGHGRYLSERGRDPERAAVLAPWVAAWYGWVSATYLRAYIEHIADAQLLPRHRTTLQTLLDVYVLEKAVYEIGYEMNNRPAWVEIPLDGISYVIGKHSVDGRQ